MRKRIDEITYVNNLDLFETQLAIKFVKDTFQKELIKNNKPILIEVEQ